MVEVLQLSIEALNSSQLETCWPDNCFHLKFKWTQIYSLRVHRTIPFTSLSVALYFRLVSFRRVFSRRVFSVHSGLFGPARTRVALIVVHAVHTFHSESSEAKEIKGDPLQCHLLFNFLIKLYADVELPSLHIEQFGGFGSFRRT